MINKVIILGVIILIIIGYWGLKIACVFVEIRDSVEHRREVKEIIKDCKEYEKTHSLYGDIDSQTVEECFDIKKVHSEDKSGLVAEDHALAISVNLEQYKNVLNLHGAITCENINQRFRELAKIYHPFYGTEPDEGRYGQIVSAKNELLDIISK